MFAIRIPTVVLIKSSRLSPLFHRTQLIFFSFYCLDSRLEVPKSGPGCQVNGSLLPSAVPCHQPGWRIHRDRGRRRNSQILERILKDSITKGKNKHERANLAFKYVYSGDLNNGLVRYSNGPNMSDHQMVCYSSHDLNTGEKVC